MNFWHQAKRFNYIFFFCCFMFFFYLAYNTPLTGDDWTWGTWLGMKRLDSWFAGYNGRYLSNLIELIITRCDWLRYVIMALFSSLLIYLVGKVAGTGKKNNLLMLSFILFLCVPVNVFAQTFGWAAGFVNYITSLVFLLTYLLIVRNILGDTKPSYSKWLTVLTIPLGILTQINVEHVSIFAVFTGVCVIFYTYYKHRSFYLLHFVYLISLIIGSVIMFTNSAYWKVLNGSDSYRTIKSEAASHIGIIERVYNSYTGDMYKLLFLNNIALNLFIGVMVLILILNFKSELRFIQLVIKPILITIISGFILYSLVLKSAVGNNFLGYLTNDFEAFICSLFYISIVVSILFFIKDSVSKIRLIYYLIGVILLTAPFIFITPFGPRCVFASYTFMVLAGLELFSYNAKTLSWSPKTILKPLLAVVLVLIIGYSFILGMNGSTNRERLAYLKNAVDAHEKVIKFRELPYPQFHWMSTPYPHLYQTIRFKEYYNVPPDTKLKVVPYRKWKK